MFIKNIFNKFTQLKFSYKINLYSILILGIMIFLGLFYFVKLSNYKGSLDNIRVSYDERDSYLVVISSIAEIHTKMYQSLSWSSAGYEEKKIMVLIEDAEKKLQENIKKIYEFEKNSKGDVKTDSNTTNVSDEQLIYTDIRSSLEKYNKWMMDVKGMIFTDSAAANMMMGSAETSYQEIGVKLQKLANLKRESTSNVHNHAILSLDSMKISILVIMVFAMLFVSIFAWNISRSVNYTASKLISSNSRVKSLANQMAQENDGLSHRTAEQVEVLERLLSVMKGLYSTLKGTSADSSNANNISLQASNVADQGHHSFKDMKDAMLEISTSSKRISDIITIVDEIAFQINILAINAAIEAAKAGDQGTGFAVVAIEVRDLAQRTTLATKDIKKLIEDSIFKIENGEKLVNLNNEKLLEVIAKVNEISAIVTLISSKSNEHCKVLEEILNTFLKTFESTTRKNNILVEDISNSSKNMLLETNNMDKVIISNFGGSN